MVDRTVVLEGATELAQAQEDIVEGLGAIADEWLKEFHNTKDFIKAENEWRKHNLKGEDRDPLYSDAQGRIVWDFSVLLNTISGKRWNHFVDAARQRGLNIPNKQEIWLDIKTLVHLRDKSLGHRHLGEFTKDDYRDFFRKGERVLLSLGAEAQVEKLRAGGESSAETAHETALGDLAFSQVITFPQWASHPKIIPLSDYRRSSIAIKGLLSSASPYFRFGFKLMNARDKIFSPGSIQTEWQNIVVHLGKNIHDSDLFLTVYKSGIRLDRNKVLMNYEQDLEVPIALELSREGIIRLHVNDGLAYETFFEMDGPAQLVILAWGDENYFECRFRQAVMMTRRL